VEVETTPADASPGLFMKGLGGLNFKCMKSTESGFFVPYNVKDLQVLHGKGKTSVVVSVNNDMLRVFQAGKSSKGNLSMK
jgi:hypothetical protein